MKRIELLAPAGDLNRCRTAIRYGADAVYIGGRSFSLRSRASNFSLADIREACRFAKEYHARIHVTVNIIPHNDDFEGLEEYLKELEEAGVTAIITASPSIMELAKKTVPSLEVHCSTQLSITNAETARFLQESLHVDRVVLARECTMDDIRSITAGSPVETEAFIHGGMCVNYSGRCTLSNRMTLRDANRGGCAQSCRWFYHLYEKEEEISDPNFLFTMGSKDLCAVDEIAALMEAGVSSLKIEGRMKTDYYVASIVSAYRHLIDELYESGGRLDDARMAYHRNEIMKGENRQVCTGFYNGIAAADSLIDHANSNADVNHGFLGRVTAFENGIASLQLRNPIAVGDAIEVMTPGMTNRTFRIRNLWDENGEELTECRHPMRIVKIPVPFTVMTEDIFRKGTI